MALLIERIGYWFNTAENSCSKKMKRKNQARTLSFAMTITMFEPTVGKVRSL